MRHLRARPQRELALRGVPLRDTAAPFEGCRGLPVRAERPLDHHGRGRQGPLHVSVFEPARQEHALSKGTAAVLIAYPDRLALEVEGVADTGGAQHVEGLLRVAVVALHQNNEPSEFLELRQVEIHQINMTQVI